MDNNSFEQKVDGIDWTKYLAPEYYDPAKMNFNPDELTEVLIQLSQTDESNCNTGFLSKARFALGNDHRGTYYPAALEAIDLIIEIEKTAKNQNARNCAKYILNDLHYFELEMGGADGNGSDESLYDAISNSIFNKGKAKTVFRRKFRK